jgi:3'(2'), 5'-bisphosphate nucleotidase
MRNADVAGLELLDGLTLAASRAAAAILAVPSLELNRRDKADASPVTAADEAAEAAIRADLARLMPGVTVISEETTGNRAVSGLGRRWLLVDPLDGTREFVAGRDEYTVNIALIEDGVPVAGVVGAPARGLIWRGRVGHGAERIALRPGAAIGAASERIAIRTRRCPASGARVLVSRSHLDAATKAFVERFPQPEMIPCGSALKFCLLAEGSADIYPRLGPTSEWDIAAGHAVLAAAGGSLRRPDGGEMRYGTTEFRVPGFIAVGDPDRPL